MERLKSQEAIWYAKAELVEALPSHGWAVLNADDPLVWAMRDMTAAQVFSYGVSPHATLRADAIVSYGLGGIGMRVHYRDEAVHMRLPLIGRHSVYLALAAMSVGLILGMEWPEMIAGLRDPAAQVRLRVVAGQQGTTLIDDTYNAAPISTLAALDLLADTPGRRVAILGDMLELGSAEEKGHRDVGQRAAEVADLLVTVGERAHWIAEAARQAGLPSGQIVACMRNDEAIAAVQPRLMPGDHVLLKASRGMALEEIVMALQPQPEEEH